MSSNVPNIRFVGGDAAGPSFLYMNAMEHYDSQQIPLLESPGLAGPDLAGSLAGPDLAGSAIFDDADAGSGAVEPSIQSGVSNLLQHHMNTATSVLPDARDILRNWNRQLRNTLQQQSSANLAFLKAETLTTIPALEKHALFLKSIDTPGILSSPSWLSLYVKDVVNKDEVLADLSGVLGTSISGLQHTLREALHVYQSTVADMFTAHTRLQKKLDQTDQYTKKLMALTPPNDPSPEAETLRQSILTYANVQYDSLKIKDDYVDFCTLYTKFQAIRSVLLLQQTAESSPPICTICMTDPINMALTPCGHTFCSPCGSKQRSQCYICRVAIRDRQRLYFI
jgi:hypothetical protein